MSPLGVVPNSQPLSAPQLTNHQELWAFIVTNLASVYIREGNRHQEVVGDMLHGAALSAVRGAAGPRRPSETSRHQVLPPWLWRMDGRMDRWAGWAAGVRGGPWDNPAGFASHLPQGHGAP